jgi:hypothetical protein
VTQEANMPFSMPSYFLGVGTVVGALAFGFGGGVLLTRTAIKDMPPSRIERAARAETPVARQIAEARAVPVPRADSSTTVQPAPQLQAAAENPKPVAETPREEPVKVPETARQVEAPKQEQRQADAARQIEQREAEPRLTEREQRRAEREKRYTERKARAMAAYARMRQRPLDDPQQQERQPARPELAFEREAPRPNLFEGLFGRPQDTAPGDGRE